MLRSWKRIALASCIALWAGCARTDTASQPAAFGGVLDLRQWDFSTNGPIALAGDFEFYWARLLSESPAGAVLVPDGYVHVPAPWNHQPLSDGRPLPPFGFGTYRVQLLLAPGQSDFAFFLPGEGHNVRVYVNGTLIAERGHPDKTPGASLPDLTRTIVQIPALLETNDLRFEISNFHHARGGLWNGMILGPTETLRSQREGRVVLEVFLFGSLLLAAVYHIALFALRRKDRAPLYFAAICVLVATRIIFTGEHYALVVLPKLPWEWALRLEYLSYFLGVPAITAFFTSFFPDEFPRLVRNVIALAASVFVGIVLLTRSDLFSHTPFYFHVLTAVSIGFILRALVLALQRRREGAVTTCAGFVILTVSTSNDMASHAFALGWVDLAPFGLFGFATMQSISLSVRYTRAFQMAEELTAKLDEKVQERTQAAEAARDEVMTLNDLTRRINTSSNLDQILDDVFLHVEATYGIQGCWAFFLNESSQQIYTYRYSAAAARSLPDEKRQILAETIFSLDEPSGLTFTIKRRRPLYVRSIERFGEHVTKLDAYMSDLLQTRSFLYAPLVLKDQCAGLIAFANIGSTLTLKLEHVHAIQRVCDQVAGAIYTARLLLEAQEAKGAADRARAEAEQLNMFAKKVYSSTDLSAIADDVFAYIEQNYRIEGSLLFFADHEKKELQAYRFSERAKKHLKQPAQELLRELVVPFSLPGSLSITARRKRALLVQDIHAWGRLVTASDKRLADLIGLTSFLHIPMIIGDELVGIICFSNFLRPLELQKEEMASIERFCQQITGAIYNSRLLQKNKEAREKLEEADRAKTAFFQSVSHELRTPLTLIKGPVESAWRKGEAIDAEHLKPVVFNTRRLLRLVNQLLDIQKVTAGRMEAKPVPISPTPFLSIVHNAFDPYTRARGINLIDEVEQNLPVIEVDTDHLDKCLYNYLSNAMKFTHKGGDITLRARTVHRQSGAESGNGAKRVRIEVQDTGTGIASERVAELFQRFGHSEASLTREQEGTGLGLALVKELVELQHGEVGVTSEIGKGSVFWMEFPAAAEGTKPKLLSLNAGRSMADLELVDGVEGVAKPAPPKKLQAAAGRQRLLIVEDNPDLRAFICGIFEDAGYQTIIATNGEEGLRSAMLHRPDLIVTDLMMPKMSGIEMIAAIRSRTSIKTVPVLLLTAKADLGTRREVTAAGADAYLPKPFNDEELLDVAANLLSLKTTEKSLMKELQQARLIQENLLPTSLPDVPGIRLSAVYEPMELVGGDLYDFVELRDNTLGIFVADVSGHGIPAAMIASLAKVILTLFGPDVTSPCELLGYLNDQLYGKTAGNFLTAWYGIYNPKTRALTYATAGHPAPILVRNRQSSFQTSKGPALGWLIQAVMKDTTVVLKSGDRLYIYSDGLTEAADAQGVMFEDQGLVASILQMTDLPLGVTVNQAVSDAREFQGGGVFQDDVTLVGLEVL